MRDILMVCLFAAAAVATLRRPYWGALLWVWIGLMNPHRLAYGFAYSLPFALATVAVVAVAMLMHTKEVRRPPGGVVGIMLVFIVWMALTTAAAILPGASWTKYQDVLKVLGMTLVVASLVHTREQIIGLVWVAAGSIAFYGTKGGVFTIASGGGHRVWGPPGSAVFGNNELALALIITIPLLYALARHVDVAREFVLVRFIKPGLLKWGLYASCVLCAASALGSHSRGAFVAITAMAAMLWWRSRSKLMLGLLMLAMVPVGVSMMPAHWFERMETIQSYEQDLSALQRINAWETAINIANDRVTGAGFATATPAVFDIYSPRKGREWVYVAHSIYFQVLGDHGYVGLALYLLFWVMTYRMAGRIVRLTRPHAQYAWAAELGNMAKVSMVGFAVGGAFLSLAYWDMPYYIPVILAAIERLVRQELKAAAPAAAPADPARTQAAVPAGS
jgi:probable O-glycosylation ligase (exosortase A-associated)